MARLSADTLEKELAGTGLRCFLFPELDSTNSEAKRRIRDGSLTCAALFLAERQSAGRGRLGRQFYSPPETGIYMTLALPVCLSFAEAVRMTGKSSVAVYNALDSFAPGELGIKWVNDIYRAGSKVAGILVEALPDEKNSHVRWLAAGVGVNIATESFPGPLAETAGSLRRPDLRREAVVAEIARQLLKESADFSDLSYLNVYRSRSLVLGREIRFGQEGAWETGWAEEIDDLGRLIVRKDDGTCAALGCGEVSVRLT